MEGRGCWPVAEAAPRPRQGETAWMGGGIGDGMSGARNQEAPWLRNGLGRGPRDGSVECSLQRVRESEETARQVIWYRLSSARLPYPSRVIIVVLTATVRPNHQAVRNALYLHIYLRPWPSKSQFRALRCMSDVQVDCPVSRFPSLPARPALPYSAQRARTDTPPRPKTLQRCARAPSSHEDPGPPSLSVPELSKNSQSPLPISRRQHAQHLSPNIGRGSHRG
jgi:hypothetical protein